MTTDLYFVQAANILYYPTKGVRYDFIIQPSPNDRADTFVDTPGQSASYNINGESQNISIWFHNIDYTF